MCPSKPGSLKTRPYTEEEMNQLWHQEYGIVRNGLLEKVTGEEALDIIVSDDKQEITRRVIEIANRTNPRPIVVITDAFPDSFLVGKQYHHKSKDPIFEQIVFEYNADHWSRTQQQQPPMPGRKKKAEKEAAQKAYPDNMSEIPDEMLAMANQKMAESMGMASFDQFIKYLQDGMRKAALAGVDEKEAKDQLSRELQEKYYQHGGQGAHAEMENPRETLKYTTIQFRVIGKEDNHLFGNYSRYYSKFHNFPLHAAIANIIADSSVSVRYSKPSGERVN
jgi:hypothetical protein